MKVPWKRLKRGPESCRVSRMMIWSISICLAKVFWSVSSVIRSTCRKGTGLTFGQVKKLAGGREIKHAIPDNRAGIAVRT